MTICVAFFLIANIGTTAMPTISIALLLGDVALGSSISIVVITMPTTTILVDLLAMIAIKVLIGLCASLAEILPTRAYLLTFT